MTVKEVAKKLNVSEKTVHRYIKYGKNGVRLNINAKYDVADFVKKIHYLKTGEESTSALDMIADEFKI